MYPNGNNIPFYYSYGNPSMTVNSLPKSGGLFSRLGGVKGINWQGLLNNTSKTLGLINQAIPVVKQVGPMYNNMKSMLKVASLFKDETDPIPSRNNNNNSNNSNNKQNNINNNNEIEKENTIINNNYSNNSPNFFI